MDLWTMALDRVLTILEPPLLLDAPKFIPERPNRVDAYPQLITYHKPSLSSPTAVPSSTYPNKKLPLRTDVTDDFTMETSRRLDIEYAQTNAFYEEVLTLPAAAVGYKSVFEYTGHLYLIHPLPQSLIWEWSTLALQKIKKWIEETETDVYVSQHKQVVLFCQKRKETVEVIQRVLDSRKRIAEKFEDEEDEEEGYLGTWKAVEECDNEDVNISERTIKQQVKNTTGVYNTEAFKTMEGIVKRAIAGAKNAEERGKEETEWDHCDTNWEDYSPE
ncbi:hypothetical protein B0J11DRAFT_501830 [Dendryphion nanum]|uniref:Uncharacterized protein n=1 Tax=Dendryphion nanum TaxID=256645 RepID=A0A9P9IYC2_9PLEO|nr:hypothetical protein B0J11DRAFT_501830 [Dendryphion nanum]